MRLVQLVSEGLGKLASVPSGGGGGGGGTGTGTKGPDAPEEKKEEKKEEVEEESEEEMGMGGLFD